MSITSINWIKVEQYCDQTPFLSTLSNLLHLFFKAVNSIYPSFFSKPHYFTYLEQKSVSSCLKLLVPFWGNATIVKDLSKETTVSKTNKAQEYLNKQLTSGIYLLEKCPCIKALKKFETTESINVIKHLRDPLQCPDCTTLKKQKVVVLNTPCRVSYAYRKEEQKIGRFKQTYKEPHSEVIPIPPSTIYFEMQAISQSQ